MGWLNLKIKKPPRRRRPSRSPAEAVSGVGRQVVRGTRRPVRRATDPGWGSASQPSRPSRGGGTVRLGPPKPGRSKPGPFPTRSQASVGAGVAAGLRLAPKSPEGGGGILGTGVSLPEPPGPVRDAFDFVKGGGVPGVIVRELDAGDKLEAAGEEIGDIGDDLFDEVIKLYGGQKPKTDRKGPPAPGQDVPGPFREQAASRRGLAGIGNLPAAANPISTGLPARIGAATIKAALEEPSVVPKTLKGGAEIAVGTIAALGEIPVQTVVGTTEGDPLRGVRELGRIPGELADDYSRRYGPLAEGTAEGEREFIRRVQEEGAAPEVLDFLGVAAGAGATGGRALGAALRASGSGPYRGGARPRLRLSGDASVQQELSPNAFRAFAQRAEDKVRAGERVGVGPIKIRLPSAAASNRKLRDRDEPVRGLEPFLREGEVARRTLRGQAKGERLLVARRQSQAFTRGRLQLREEVQAGFRKEVADLPARLRPAVFHVTQGLVDPTDKARAVAQLTARRDRLVAEREAVGMRPVPKVIRRRNDEIRTIDHLIENADKIFGGDNGKRLDRFREFQAARSTRMERAEAEALPGVGMTALTAEARRLRPQGEELGVEFPAQRIRELDQEIALAARTADGPEGRDVVARLLQEKDRTQAEYIDAVRGARGGTQEVTADSLRGAYEGVTDPETGAALRNVKASGPQQWGDKGERMFVRADIVLDGKKIGSITRQYDVASGALIKEITNVDKEHQRRGIASRLAAAEERAVERAGVRAVEVVPGTEAGRALSTRIGGWDDAGEGRLRKRLNPERRETGLREPGFVSHQKRPRAGFSDYTVTNPKKPAGRSKRTDMELLRTGRADVSPEAIEQGYARSIKRTEQWQLVADVADKSAVKVTPADLERAGIVRDKGDGTTRAARPDELTVDEWLKYMDERGLDPRDWVLYNPEIVRRTKAELDTLEAETRARAGRDMDGGDEQLVLGDEAAALALDEGTIAVAKNRVGQLPDSAQVRQLMERADPTLKRQEGWQLIPRGAYDEINAATQPSGSVGRTFEKLQGLQSRVLLGLSPSWLQIQIAGNALLTGIGVRGNVAAPLQAYLLWKRMPDDVKRDVNIQLGAGVLRGHGERARYGSQAPTFPGAEPIVNFTRFLKETAFFRKAGQYNPINLVFAADDASTAALKRTVLLDKVRRDAYRRMGQNSRDAMREIPVIERILRLPPRERVEALLRDQESLERFAQRTDNILGDYVTYTARERRYLKRGVMFYGFLRFSLRTLFYTLPVKHPVAASVAAKLGQLHNEEVAELLGGGKSRGGAFEAPWAYARVFINREGKGLESIDLARANPVTNPIVDAVTKGPRAFSGLMSPAILAATNQVYSTNLFTNRPFRVGGSAKERRDLPLFSAARAKIGLSSALQPIYPYRAAFNFFHGRETQTDDALLGFPQPIKYKTKESQEAEQARRRQRGSGLDRLLEGAAPLAFPEPDFTRQQVRRVREERRKETGRSGGGSSGWGAAGGSSSSGGGWGSAGG